jgi:hypothetical protein
MRKLPLLPLTVFVIAFFLLNTGCSSSKKTASGNKNKTLAAMELANKYFMEKWPDAGKEIHVPSRNRTWPSHIWTRAVYYEGLMALYSVDKKPALLRLCGTMGRKA